MEVEGRVSREAVVVGDRRVLSQAACLHGQRPLAHPGRMLPSLLAAIKGEKVVISDQS